MKSASTVWPADNNSVELKNQFAIVQFNHLRTKQKIYKNWLNQFGKDRAQDDLSHLEPKSECQDGVSEATGVVLIECGIQQLHRIVDLPVDCIRFGCEESNDLVDLIDLISKRPRNDVGQCRLNTIVVENLSAFYWNLRCTDRQTRSKWYRDVNQALLSAMDRFKCNVVVTMWDREYERGYKSKRSGELLKDQKILSYTPLELYNGCHFGLSYQDDGTYMYIEGHWKPVASTGTTGSTLIPVN